MTIIMIIMNNRGQSCGLWEADLCDLCFIFSIYGCVLLDSHWNQWDSFQQLPWSLAGALNCLLQQGKINRAVGSWSADDWIDTLKFPSTFTEEAGKGQGCRGGRCCAAEQTAAPFLSNSFRASEEFQTPNDFTGWCSGLSDLDPESCLWNNSWHFCGKLHVLMETKPVLIAGRPGAQAAGTHYTLWSYLLSHGGLSNQAVCCKTSPRSDVNQLCCRDSSLLWKWEGILKIFTEELLQETHCFLAAHRGQIPLHQAGFFLGQLQQRHLQHKPIAWVCPLKKDACWIFSSVFPQFAFWRFSWPVLMPRGYSSECCSTTE